MQIVEIKNIRKNAYTDLHPLHTFDFTVIMDTGEEYPYTWMQGDPHGLGPAMDALFIPLLETMSVNEIIAEYPVIDLRPEKG